MPRITLGQQLDAASLSRAETLRCISSMEAASAIASRLRDRRGTVRDSPVRRVFFNADKHPDATPPMAELLSTAGRGGGVPLKLLLSLLWASSGGEHDTDFEASDWAKLLGLPQYSTAGKRRALAAIQSLERQRVVRVEGRRGRPSRLVLLHESGDGTPYSKPSVNPTQGERTYSRLSPLWWTNGWMAVVDGVSLALWLAIDDRCTKAQPNGPVWLSESVTTHTFGLSPSQRQRAMRQLGEHGLIRWRTQRVKSSFRTRPARTMFTLQPQRLDSPPTMAS